MKLAALFISMAENPANLFPSSDSCPILLGLPLSLPRPQFRTDTLLPGPLRGLALMELFHKYLQGSMEIRSLSFLEVVGKWPGCEERISFSE